MEQIIIASHTIKPSSPTPFSSKYQKLSLFDQTSPSMYVPLIFFYKSHDSKQHEEISRRLKQSLSEILTVFYPLAGTIHQNSYVDCNDKGAEFVEARVHARLSQFLENPKMEELRELLGPASLSDHDDDDVILSVKTCIFDCGGISVGICLSHKVADGESVVAFINAWAATCRNGEASGTCQSPSFDLPFHFPPVDLPPASVLNLGMAKEKIVTKRLVFSREEVEKMVAEASTGEIRDPSRVEAVTAFIWRSFIQANKAARTGTTETSFTATHAVNLRPRAVPRLPNQSFGNCYLVASAVISSQEGGNSSGMLVSKLRAAIRSVSDEYIKQVVNNANVFIEAFTKQANDIFKPGNCVFTSWWRFPVYEVDFGWGKPVRVSTATMPYMNLVVLMDTPSGDGVEAWISVRDEDTFQVFQDNYNKLVAHKLH